MPFLSELLGRPVVDVNGERVGQLKDVLACLRAGAPHPVVVGLEIKQPGGLLLLSFADVTVLVAPAISLTRRADELRAYHPGEGDVFLARDVLDKQIIDTNGVRVVRVNDVELARINGRFYLANVDIGGAGLLRRLGLSRLAHKLAARREQAPGVIAWDQVEILPGDRQVRLRVSGDRIAELHPADLAEIISDLSPAESSRLLDTLDVKTVADALEEVEPDFQASLVEQMPDHRVADVLEEMAPDEAADLLAELPEDRSQEILSLMEDEEAEDVRMLLGYPEDTAGGIMNTEFIAIRPDHTAEQAIAILREEAHEAETITYIYVVDDERKLLGVFSLRDLVLAEPHTPVTQFMHDRVVTADLHDSQDVVAQDVAKYNLVAVPVVDDEGRLQGIVTADDALDKVIPTAWKKRLPRLYH